MKIIHRDCVVTYDDEVKGTYTDVGTLDSDDTVFYEDKAYVPFLKRGGSTLFIDLSVILELPDCTELHVLNADEKNFDYYTKDGWVCEIESAPKRAKCKTKKAK